MDEMYIKRTIKLWIIDKLDGANKKNFEANINEVAGYERVLNYLLGYDTDGDKEIHEAYKRLNERIYNTF